MDLQTVLIWLFVILIFVTAYWYLTVPNNLPPGPVGVPILGNAPFVSRDLHLQSIELAKKYGNVFRLYVGSVLVVVLNDFAAIKEALVKQPDVFSSRYRDADVSEISGEFPGLLFSNGEHWRQHRRFLVLNLRDYGVGKSSIEPHFLDEIKHFLDLIKKQNGAAIEMKDHLSPSLANNIQILVTGQRVDYEHPTTRAIMKAVKSFEEFGRLLALTTFIPWAKPILSRFYPKRLLAYKQCRVITSSAVNSAIDEVKSKYIEGQTNNYIQAYLTERNNRLKTNKNEKIFTELALMQNTQDLLMAGTNTSASTLAWATLYMALHLDVQKRVQREIDDVIGRHREPSYADRINTPYTEATINELHRVISLAPFSVPCSTTKATTLFGYHIPKDTHVFANLYAVHHDVSLWGDPENFRPERFIGPNGKCVKPEYLIPFGIGSRACAGEPLARMELYLYFVSMLQHFNFVAPPGVKLTLEATRGISLQAKSYLICAKPRLD